MGRIDFSKIKKNGQPQQVQANKPSFDAVVGKQTSPAPNALGLGIGALQELFNKQKLIALKNKINEEALKKGAALQEGLKRKNVQQFAAKNLPGTMKSLADLQENPFNFQKKGAPKEGILRTFNKDIESPMRDEAQRAAEFFKALTHKTPISEIGGKGLGLLTGGANIAFSPISGAFGAAEKVPLLGSAAKLASLPFNIAGEAGSGLAGAGLNKLPISQQTKQNLAPSVQELGALLAQIGVGKLGHSMNKGIKKVTSPELKNVTIPKGTDFISSKPTAQDILAQQKTISAQKIPSNLLNTEHAANIFTELDTAAAGKRIKGIDGTSMVQHSTFPDWVSPELKNTSLFNEVKQAMIEDKVPQSKPAQRLYDEVRKELNMRTGIEEPSTSPSMSRTKEATLPPPERTVAPSTPRTGRSPAIQGNDRLSIDKPLTYNDVISKTPEHTTSSEIGQAPKNLNPVHKLIRSGKAILEKAGQGGKELAKTMDAQRKSEAFLSGEYKVRIDNALGKLKKDILRRTDKKELANFDAALRGEAKPMNNNVASAIADVRKLLDEIGTTAEQMKFEIKNSSGKSTPFKKRENYAPQMYDFTKLEKGKQRTAALQHLVKSGQARNLAEATKLLDGVIKKNADRRFGNLEKAREINLPTFNRDPKFYLQKYAQSAAKRFTEVEHFGMKDAKAAEMINKIANEGGDYSEAQRIFDFTTKGAPQNKIINTAMQYNLATKLDLAAITNATQSINTMAKAGFFNTLKGMKKGFTKAGKEAADLAGIEKEFIQSKEAGVSVNRIVKGTMWLFGKVESFNRRTAANTGQIRARQLIEKRYSKFAQKELADLGVSKESIKSGKLTLEDMKSAAYEMARKTQFQVDPLDIPPAWKTPAGKLFTQFKSFSFRQSNFIWKEVLKPLKQGNPLPLVRFVPLALASSFVAQLVRNFITGRDPKDALKDKDIRSLDMYLKAFGDMASQQITQGKFLYDTYKKMEKDPTYVTPLKFVSRVAGSLGGPTIGEGGNFLTALESIPSASQKNLENRSAIEKGTVQKQDPYLELKRFIAGDIPLAGERLKNTTYAYPKSTKTPEEKAKSKSTYDFMDELRKEKPNSEAEKKKMQEYIRSLPKAERKGKLYQLSQNGFSTKGISIK